MQLKISPYRLFQLKCFFNSEGKPYTPSEEVGVELTMYSSRDTGEHVFTVHQGGLTEEEMREILKDMGVE